MAITLKCHTTSLGIATIYLPEPDYYKGLKGSGQKSGVSLRRSFDCDPKAAVHWLIGNLTPHLISCYEPQAQQTHQVTIKSYKNKTIARRQRNTPQLAHTYFRSRRNCYMLYHIDSVAAVLTLNHSCCTTRLCIVQSTASMCITITRFCQYLLSYGHSQPARITSSITKLVVC